MNTNLPRPKPIKPPDLKKRTLAEAPPLDALAEQETYSDILSQDQQLALLTSAHNIFQFVVFNRTNLRESRLAHLTLRDVRLSNCDLANAEWFATRWYRVELLDCRITGFKGIESHYQDTLLRECQARLAQFRYSTFKGARFESCDLAEADFQGSDLSGAVFDGCDLSGADLSQTRLANADFRGSRIDNLRVGVEDLRGAIFDPAQAITLVRLLGIQIAWEEGNKPWASD